MDREGERWVKLAQDLMQITMVVLSHFISPDSIWTTSLNVIS
jgi:hypothetical protein